MFLSKIGKSARLLLLVRCHEQAHEHARVHGSVPQLPLSTFNSCLVSIYPCLMSILTSSSSSSFPLSRCLEHQNQPPTPVTPYPPAPVTLSPVPSPYTPQSRHPVSYTRQLKPGIYTTPLTVLYIIPKDPWVGVSLSRSRSRSLSLSRSLCVCACAYVCTCVCVTWLCLCVLGCSFACVCGYICVCLVARLCMILSECVCTHVYVCVCTIVHLLTWVYVCTILSL
jgi:hypothetical protein